MINPRETLLNPSLYVGEEPFKNPIFLSLLFLSLACYKNRTTYMYPRPRLAPPPEQTNLHAKVPHLAPHTLMSYLFYRVFCFNSKATSNTFKLNKFRYKFK
jgi:hypothetical protein